MLPKIARKELLDYLLSDVGLNATFRLAKNNPVVSDENIVLADITEADFVGYAPISGIVFPAATINGADHGETISPIQTWTAGAIVGPQTIFAAYITITIGGIDRLLFWRRFGASITLMNPGEEVEKRFDILSDDGNVPAFGA